MNHSPSTTVLNGDRDRRGRFAPGNRAALGNPHARRVAQLRSAMLCAITEDELGAIARVVIDKALTGDLEAVRLLWNRLYGRPAQGLYEADGPSGEPTKSPEQLVRILILADLADRVPPGLESLVEPVRRSLREGGAIEDVEE